MPCVWLYRSLPQVSHPWPPRNSGKVNFVATRMPNRTEITKVTSDAKTWARIRSYSIDGSAPKLWVFARSFRYDKFCPEVVTYPHLGQHSCLDQNRSESNSQGRPGHQATARTPQGPVQNCPTLAADASLPKLVESATPDCRPKQAIHGDRRSRFPDNWVRWSVWPFRANHRIAAVKFGNRDPAVRSLLALPAEEPYLRRQPVRAGTLQIDVDSRVFPAKQTAAPPPVGKPPYESVA